MAKQSGLNQRFYIAGYDISGDVGSITKAAASRNVQDITGLDKSALERIGLHADGLLDFTGFMNTGTDKSHDALKGLPPGDVGVMYLIGTTRGDPVAAMMAKQANYDVTRNADGSLAIAVATLAAPGAPLEWCKLLVQKIAHSVAAPEASLDNAASSPNGAVGFLQHFDWSSGTIEYDIEDSSDDSAWVNLIPFTDQTSATGFTERKFVSGLVNRYLRAATNGTFTNADFAMAIRRRLDSPLDLIFS